MKRYFLTRVQLHNLPKENNRNLYNDLHSELANRDFYKEIRGDDKVVYLLPDAMYESFTLKTEGNFTVDHVRALAKASIEAVVAAVKKTHPFSTLYGAVLVAEMNNGRICWTGLEKAPTSPSHATTVDFGKPQ
jgi:hypothetical protein